MHYDALKVELLGSVIKWLIHAAMWLYGYDHYDLLALPMMRRPAYDARRLDQLRDPVLLLGLTF